MHAAPGRIDVNLGEDMAQHDIERQGGTADQPEKRWRALDQLLSSPRLPSGLRYLQLPALRPRAALRMSDIRESRIRARLPATGM